MMQHVWTSQELCTLIVEKLLSRDSYVNKRRVNILIRNIVNDVFKNFSTKHIPWDIFLEAPIYNLNYFSPDELKDYHYPNTVPRALVPASLSKINGSTVFFEGVFEFCLSHIEPGNDNIAILTHTYIGEFSMATGKLLKKTMFREKLPEWLHFGYSCFLTQGKNVYIIERSKHIVANFGMYVLERFAHSTFMFMEYNTK